MNQVAPRQQFSLAPESFADAMALANKMSEANLVPKHLQGQPADCLLVIEQALRWGLSPFAVAQETSVIQGKIMYSGKLTAAVVNALGGLAGPLQYEYSGAGDNRIVRVIGRVAGESMPRTVEVRLGDVKTANKVWTSQPDQQLAYHGARVWARRHKPDALLGIWAPEEMDDVMEVAAPRPAVQPPAPRQSAGRQMPAIAPNPMRAIAPPEAPTEHQVKQMFAAKDAAAHYETNGTRHDEDGVVAEGEPEIQDDLDAKRADAFIKLWVFAIQEMTVETRVETVNKWNKEGKREWKAHGLTQEEHDSLQRLVIAKNKMLKDEEANGRVQA